MKLLTPATALPLVMIVLQLGAAAAWAYHGDIRRAVYWVAAAVLTATITW